MICVRLARATPSMEEVRASGIAASIQKLVRACRTLLR